MTSTGFELVRIASIFFGLEREPGETDESLRQRCIAKSREIVPDLSVESDADRRKRKVEAILYRNGVLRDGVPRALIEELVDLIGEEVLRDDQRRRGGW